MILTSWNIRGLNSKGKHRHLAARLRKEKPQIMLIQETKISGQKMEEILNKIKPRYEQVTIDGKGSAGGIVVIRNPTEVISEWWIGMPRILTGRFRHIGESEWVAVSAVYGPHTQVDRGLFLSHLEKLKNFHQEQIWIIIGDFNLITSREEKKCGESKRGTESRNKMHTFQLRHKEIKGKIKKLNREEFGNIQQEKGKLETRLEGIQQQIIKYGRREELAEEEGRVINQLEERRKQEEILWKYKSRVQWLKDGEKNSKFFHKEC
eukprot:PITA_21277